MSTAPTLTLRGLTMMKQVGEFRPAVLDTNNGIVETRWYEVPKAEMAILWLGDNVGGFDSPANGLFDKLAVRYKAEGVASLRVQYRMPSDRSQVGLDALVCAFMMQKLEVSRIVVVSWGAGAVGACAVARGFPTATGLALLAPSDIDAAAVAGLDRPLLILHGTGDRVAPTKLSRELLAKADEPKRIIYYPDADHTLAAVGAALETDLSAWLDRQLGVGPAQG